MAATLTALKTVLKMSIKLTSAKAASLSTPGALTTLASDITLNFGAGAGLNDIMYAERVSLAASGTKTFVLGNDSMTDEYGDAISFAKIKGWAIHNRSDDLATPTDAELAIGGAAVNPWQGFFADVTDKIELPAGFTQLIYGDDANGKVVTAASDEQFLITNLDGADAAEFDVVIFGESA